MFITNHTNQGFKLLSPSFFFLFSKTSLKDLMENKRIIFVRMFKANSQHFVKVKYLLFLNIC